MHNMIKLRNILLEEIQKEFQPVKLGWKYKDYEPAFDAETMKLHFEKHYKGYIEKLNQAVKEENIPLTYDGDRLVIRPLLSTISTYSDKAKNNAGGFFNHNIWFNQLNPDMKGKIDEGSNIDIKIKEQYGSLDKFKSEYKEKALSNFGSGWTWLLYDKGQLRIVNTSNQDNPYMDFINEPGEILMGIDLWEHSYYLKYKNDRAKYIDAFFKIICFNTVDKRLMKAIDSTIA
jgi:Fe-Mn family superoxide dismutase